MIVNHTYTGGTLCNSNLNYCNITCNTPQIPAAILTLKHDTNTNTNLAFLKTIFEAIEYPDFKKVLDELTRIIPLQIRQRPVITSQTSTGINVVFNKYNPYFFSLQSLNNLLSLNFNKLQVSTDFKQLFTNNISILNELNEYIFNYTDQYAELMTKLAHELKKDGMLTYDIREIHGELWKKFEKDDINIIGADTFPVYICKLPTRKYVVHNEYYDNSKNIVASKLTSNYMRCYKYMIDSAPYVGDIYGKTNYEALKNAYSNSSGPTKELHGLFVKFSDTASKFNAVIKYLKENEKGINNFSKAYEYNKLLELFLTEAKQIYIKHKQIFTTNIWAIHEPNLWIHYGGIIGPNSDLTICRYKKIGDDMFFY